MTSLYLSDLKPSTKLEFVEAILKEGSPELKRAISEGKEIVIGEYSPYNEYEVLE